MDITSKEYVGLEEAYNFFNRELFGDQLPGCMITMQSRTKSKAAGYFAAGQFVHRKEKKQTDEIALNPATFRSYSDLEILSTVAHEMCHLWQRHFGKPSRSGYHNREWAKKMESIGLMPSDTGKPGGNRTGQKMSDYVITGGLFEKKAREMIDKGFRVNWESVTQFSKTREPGPETNGQNEDKKIYKYKYTCPKCGIKLWGKPGLNVICGTCGAKLVNETEQDETNPAPDEGQDKAPVPIAEEPGTPVPFFLNVKELMAFLRKRWGNRELAEVAFQFPENKMYKEFRFNTYVLKEKKGRKNVNVRWYRWKLITRRKIEEEGEADFELHRSAAGMIEKIQPWFEIYFYKDSRVQYYDAEKKKVRLATVQAVGDYDVGIKCDDEGGDYESTQKGYLVLVNYPGQGVAG